MEQATKKGITLGILYTVIVILAGLFIWGWIEERQLHSEQTKLFEKSAANDRFLDSITHDHELRLMKIEMATYMKNPDFEPFALPDSAQ